MKKHVIITTESLVKLSQCFSDPEEVQTFIQQMGDVIDEIHFYSQLRLRSETEEEGIVALLKQVCVFSMFCREHFELIHQLISIVEFRDLTEEEFQEMDKQNEVD